MTQAKIAVVGAGSWGTALAKHLSDVGHEVRLWARREEHAAAIRTKRENERYLPGAELSDRLTCSHDMEETLANRDMVLSVVPSQTKRQVWNEAKVHLAAGVPVLSASKGIENGTLAMMSEVFAEVLPDNPTGYIAGPSFAKEVAKHIPTAVVVASEDAGLAKEAQRLFSSDWLRMYTTTDVVGVELGGSLKNIMAIACGTADGLGFGHNTRAALITRGLAEITRMAVALGADPLTLMGLGGMGDLVLTCTGDLSRNRRVGLGLGHGKKLDQIIEELGEVAEGVKTTKSAKNLAKKRGVDVPITNEVYRLLYESKSPKDSVLDLMRRDLKHEQG